VRSLLAGLLTGLRLFSAFVMVGCSVISVKSGCAGRNYNPAVDPLPQRTLAWLQRHEAKLDETRRRAGQVDLLFVGDSITQDYERTGPQPFLNMQPIWDELFAPHRAMNLGFNGDRTGNVLWRLRHGEVDGLAPRNIVLLIGANNLTPGRLEPRGEGVEEITSGIMADVDELHRRMPGARILVLAILPSGFGAERTAETDAVNAAVRIRIERLGYARWLDVSGIFRDGQRLRQELYLDPQLYPGAVALHPSAAAQRMMAQAVAQALYP
jgi:lysophospholipase L1-like esterase